MPIRSAAATTAGSWCFIVANGFSGHGFKESPAVGSMIARYLTGAAADEWDTEAPMEFFSIDRQPTQLEQKAVLA